jgi:hypothetical protein
MKSHSVLAMIMSILVLYPLSMAPAMQLARARHFTGPPADTFWPLYKPLNWFTEKFPVVDQLLADYLNWWLFDLFPERHDEEKSSV